MELKHIPLPAVRNAIASAKGRGSFLSKDPMLSPHFLHGEKRGSVISISVDVSPAMCIGRQLFEGLEVLCGRQGSLFFLRGHWNLQYLEEDPSASEDYHSRLISFTFGDTIEAHIHDFGNSSRLSLCALDSGFPATYTDAPVSVSSAGRMLEFATSLPEDIVLRGSGYSQGAAPIKRQVVNSLLSFMGGTGLHSSAGTRNRVVRRAGSAGGIELIEKRDAEGCTCPSDWKGELGVYRELASLFGEEVIPKGTALAEDRNGLLHEDLSAGGKILLEMGGGEREIFRSGMRACANSSSLLSLMDRIESYFSERGLDFWTEMERTIALQLDPKTGAGRLVFMDLDHILGRKNSMFGK